jgi:hypothetical protein
LVALSLVALCAFLALALDLGMLLVAKTQAQNAADAAAMTGARTLDGTPGNNVAQALVTAQQSAGLNIVLGQGVQPNEVAVQVGSYHYDPQQQLFLPQIPVPVTDNASLVLVTVSPRRASAFAQIFGVNHLDVQTVAIAAHRPRDTCLVLDYSGSMNDESDLWNAVNYLGANYPAGVNNTSNNLDPIFPQFGHYSAVSTAQLQTPVVDPRIGKSNVTQSALGITPLVNDFYQNARGAGPSNAFLSVPCTSLATPPAGDQYLPMAGTSTTPPTFAQTVQDINGNAATPWAGYTSPPFQGFTQGPGYWGKTFFMWPPDPRPTNDWRQMFFTNARKRDPNFGLPVTDNTLLWDSTGQWNNPAGHYTINYKAILAWIKANCIQSSSAPNNPFPPQLRAGRIVYYDGVPDDMPAAAYDHTKVNATISWTDPNQRFWKEYIDFTLGVWRSPMGSVVTPGTTPCSYGPDFAWGTVQVTAPVAAPASPTGALNNSGGYAKSYTGPMTVSAFASAPQVGQLVQFGTSPTDPTPAGPLYTITAVKGTSSITLDRPLVNAVLDKVSVNLSAPYMNYYDNPLRPRHRFWFGPMTLIQYLADAGQMPGTVNDISMSTAKHGIQAALTDIQNNHPNDLVSLILFNRPVFNTNGMGGNADSPGVGAFSQAQVSLTNNYQNLIEALYYPPNSGQNDVRLYDANAAQAPRAGGDYVFDTTTNYGLMLAYNQFSGASYGFSSSQQPLGGFGRTGASRLVIVETDGMANVAAGAGFTSNPAAKPTGVNNSYYNLGPSDPVWQDLPAPAPGAPTFTTAFGANSQPAGQGLLNVATRLCALTTDTNAGPGFATPGKPVIIHCIAFGSVFENVVAPTTEGRAALNLLQQLSTIGGTPFPSSLSDADPTHDPWKIVIGDQTQRQNKMTQAFIRIMDSDVPVSLIH